MAPAVHTFNVANIVHRHDGRDPSGPHDIHDQYHLFIIIAPNGSIGEDVCYILKHHIRNTC
jgi:hypothetical protein